MEFVEMLALLIVAHAYLDYAGQGDFMAAAKNHSKPLPGVPFYQPLTAHAVLHGGAVGLITGAFWLGILEAAVHWVVDYCKCDGRISYNTDQTVHVICKVLWAYVAVAGLV